MKKTYQMPSLEFVELFTEDILDGSIVEPTNVKKDPVVIGPSIDVELF